MTKKSLIPWAVAIIATIAFGASFSELERLRVRFGEVTRHHFHDHQDVRRFMIQAAMVGVDGPIVVLGDSIAEMARLPETIGGRPVINAGIGGASIEDFQALAPILLDKSKPSICVIELGSNDGPAIKSQYAALLSELKQFSPRLLALGLTPQRGAAEKNKQIKSAAEMEGVSFAQLPLPDGAILSDHIHLSIAGSQAWTLEMAAMVLGLGSE